MKGNIYFDINHILVLKHPSIRQNLLKDSLFATRNSNGLHERIICIHIRVTQQSRNITASLYGELDHHAAAWAKDELDRLIWRYREADLILDLKNLSFMDSSGLGVILGRYKALKAAGRSMYVKNPNRQIEKVFNVSGIYKIIKKLK